MNKGLLLKVFLLFALFCQLVNKAQAQYAIGGSASADLQKSIYWLTWSPGSFGMSTNSGGTVSNIVNGTYVWQYSPTARITATISNRTLTDATTMPGYTPGAGFIGDGLDLLYNGNGVTTKAATDPLNQSGTGGPYSRGVPFSGIGTVNAANSHPIVKFDISLKVELLINSTNTWTEVKYPGMVIADAESIGWITTPVSESEYFSGTTNGPTGWRLLNLRLDNSTKNDGYLMDLSNSGKDFKIYISGQNKSDPGAQAVLYAAGATSLSNLTMKGNGRTSIAIGFVLPFDLGDAPNPTTGNSYGRPESYINDFTFVDKPINDGVGIVLKNVFNTGGAGAGAVTITPKAKVYLGNNNVDADGFPTGSVFPAGATTDNNTLNSQSNDEDGVTTTGINIKVNRGDLTVNVPSITNLDTDEFGAYLPAYLYGWIDFNNDGKFDLSEMANTVTIPGNSTAISRDLVFPRSSFGATIAQGSSTYMRLRLTKSVLTDFNNLTAYDDASITSAANGEIEDYKLNDLTGVVISGKIFNDNNGASDNVISGTALSTLSGNPLYAYLANASDIIQQKVSVSGAGEYIFAAVNNGTYKVAISTTSVSAGANINALSLVSGWAASADSYGTNNSVGSGIETGSAPNLQVTVTPTIGGNGGDVENVNFGINQAPTPGNFTINGGSNTAITQNLTVSPTADADGGTIDFTTVVIENPATLGVYATTGFTTSEGSYSLNPATGVITFTSTGEFAGLTSGINYKVRDNFGTLSNSVGVFKVNVKIAGKPDPIETTVNSAISYNVKANDGDAANLTVTGTTTVTPQAGLTVNGGSVITDPQDATKLKYTPANNFVGIDTYEYTLTKNSVTSDPITVTVTVKPRGDDDNDSTTPGIPKNTVVTTNDNGGTGSTISIVSGPATGQGTVSVNANGTSIDYDPGTFTGVTSYKYKITSPGALTSGDITVTMTVKPVGSTDTYNEVAGAPTYANAVLGNDSGAGNNATVVLTTPITSGTGGVTLNGTSTGFVYTPAGYTGTTTYGYKIKGSDGVTLSDEITVNITVKPVGSTDTYNEVAGAPTYANAVFGNDNGGNNATVILTTPITSGTGGVALNGTSTGFVYTPAGYTGTTTYGYKIKGSDGVTLSDEITVNITVKPVGSTDTYNEVAGAPTYANAVLSNDNGGNNATVVITKPITSGTGSIDPNGTNTAFVYTPNGYTGTTTYGYKIKGSDGVTLSDEITVNITVKPVGTTDTYNEIAGSTTYANAVLSNDNGGNNATVVITKPITSGTGSIDPNGTNTAFVYTPNGYTGATTYGYKIKGSDGVTLSDEITVNINVKPVGTTDTYNLVAGTATTYPNAVLSNDNGGNNATVVITTSITNGTGSITHNGTNTELIYEPNGYVGTTTYKYKIKGSDGVTLSDEITVNINVKPKGAPDNISTLVDQPIPYLVTVNDGASGTDPVVVTIVGPAPSHGAVAIDLADAKKIKYTPNLGFLGTDEYYYTLTKGGLVSDPIKVTVIVDNVLTGADDQYSTTIGQDITYDVVANDPSGTNSTIDQLTQGSAGGATVVVGGQVKYTPGPTFIGVETYKYKLKQGAITSNEITVTVTVKPKGTDDPESTVINTPASTAVKVNDLPVDAAIINITTPSVNGGTVAIDPNNADKIKYTPATDFVGKDTYKYSLTKNGIPSDPITVTVTVNPVGTDDTDSTPLNTAVTTTVGQNDGPSKTNAIIAITTNPGHGTIGTINNTAGTVQYTPASGYIGSDTYYYTLKRNANTTNEVTSAPIKVTINVYSATMTLSKTATNGFKKVDDVINYTLTVTNTGTVTLTNIVITDPKADAGSIAPALVASLAPGSTTTFTATHKVTAQDVTAGKVENQATVTAKDPKNNTVTKISDDPVTSTVDDATIVNKTTTLVGTDDQYSTTIGQAITSDVISNDQDGASSTIVDEPGSPTHGANGLTRLVNGKIEYTPNPTFIGVDTYKYKIKQGALTSNDITVTVTVKPKGVDDPANTFINKPVSTPVKGNDGASVASPVSATVTNITVPVNGGTAAIDPANPDNIKYIPLQDYVGKDTYKYSLTKNGIESDPITVTVTVNPEGADDTDSTPVNTAVATTVTQNDGPSKTNAIIAITTNPGHGTIGTINNTAGTVEYTPASGYIGSDTYYYTLTRNANTTNEVTSAPIKVTINVYSATMSLSKVANNGAAKAGDVINYTLIIKNTGTVALNNIVITDGGADAGSISPASIATLVPGSSATVTANHTVVAADVLAGKFTNQATATAKDPKNNTISKVSDDPTTTPFDDPTIVPIIPLAPASINLAKTGVFAGNQVNYTFIITNNGGVALDNITLTDAKLGLNGVTVTTPSGGLLPNASLTYNAVYTLTQADKDAGVVNNTASVSAKDPSNNTATGTGSTVTTVTTSPVATNDAAETKSGIPIIISVLTNDNPKNSTFNLTSIEIVGNPMHGTVVANADGTITYTPTAGYVGTDSFTYRVKDAYGYYTNVATVSITTNEFKDLKIPTLFSPNGDGVNDGFIIKDLADYAQNELIVLNRWGNEVYRQANYQNNWSGTGLNEGTYFYIVRLKKANGDSWVIKKGYVTLIRTFKK